jgi:membrane associated rhomboid family serine protease
MLYSKVFVGVWLAGGLMVWLLARGGAYHIGASGIVYGITAFIFFSGFIRNDPKGITASLILVFLYQGMLIGIFPPEKGISWEAHLYSALIGAVLAFMYRKINRNSRKRYDWEDEKQTCTGEWDYKKQLKLDQYDED